MSKRTMTIFFLMIILGLTSLKCNFPEKTFYLNHDQNSVIIDVEPNTLIHLKFKGFPSSGYAYFLETPKENIYTIQSNPKT